MYKKIFDLVTQIKKEKPLILNLTNEVTVDFVANGLLSLGASPIMSQSEQELEDLLLKSQALVINLGTVNDAFFELCKKACHLANTHNIPIILDPVGAGASSYRTDRCLQFIREFNIHIIRGNASEIAALSGFSSDTKGVDTHQQSHEVIEYAKTLSIRHRSTIVVSGKIDVVVKQNDVNLFERGSPWMPSITGTGCLLTAVIGAFYAIEKNDVSACSAAVVFYGCCGELAAEKAQGSGSFKNYFLDALHAMPEVDQYA